VENLSEALTQLWSQQTRVMMREINHIARYPANRDSRVGAKLLFAAWEKREGGLLLKTKDLLSPAKAFIFVRAYTVGAIFRPV
jgi:hypothetical protein